MLSYVLNIKPLQKCTMRDTKQFHLIIVVQVLNTPPVESQIERKLNEIIPILNKREQIFP